MIRFISKPDDIVETLRFRLQDLNKDKFYTVEIKEKKSQRSLEQNSLLWKNLQMASQEMGQDLMDTYCNLLEQADVKSDFVVTAFDMTEELRKSFRGAKFIKMVEVNGKEGWLFKVWIGSSKMSVQECTELLERSFDLLEELGINYHLPEWR